MQGRSFAENLSSIIASSSEPGRKQESLARLQHRDADYWRRWDFVSLSPEVLTLAQVALLPLADALWSLQHLCIRPQTGAPASHTAFYSGFS